MSYNFGQFRRKQIDSYLIPISYNVAIEQKESSLSPGVIFNEQVINLNNALNSIDEYGKRKSYYLRFKIYKNENSNQTITIKLLNSTQSQTIKKIFLKMGSSADYEIFETILTPNASYNQICFELDRISEDFSQVNEDGTYGRTINIEVENLSNIYNIINFLNTSIEEKGKLKQIGIQGPVGMLMCINGEEIRIGRTGVYEINYGISINSIGFVVEPNDKKNFLMDYQY